MTCSVQEELPFHQNRRGIVAQALRAGELVDRIEEPLPHLRQFWPRDRGLHTLDPELLP